MKILAPAGNLESLKTAVYNGADEVYLGVKEFNARNNIEGFSLENLGNAVRFAHIFGVKVYLAINILFTNTELQSAIDVVVNAYNMGVDAFILQDLGLAKILHDNYPQMELHASTQMGIHNLEGVREIEKFGFSRVVLARETPLEEIKRIRDNSNIEIEYFVHGALCVSFSGNCYLSSYIFNASGNRGKCKQLCRLPYTLKFNEKLVKKGYLLSAKDFNMIDRLSDLKNAGVTSLKIEGRARRPYYVGAVTKEYRKALDGISPNKKTIDLAFNREFTEGYFNGNGKIISLIQNHIGIHLGRVERVKFGKKFNEVFVKSCQEINPKSVLKFIDGNSEVVTISAYDVKKIDKNLYLLTTTQRITKGLEVRLISDVVLEEEFLSKTLKRKIEINLEVRQNLPIKARLKIGEKEHTIVGERLQVPIKRPISKEEIEESFSKSEYFIPKISYSHFDNVFCVKSLLNEFRRKVYALVEDVLTEVQREKLTPLNVEIPKEIKILENFEFTEREKSTFDSEVVIYNPETYTAKRVGEFVFNCKDQGKKPYLFTPNFALERDVSLLKEIVEETGVGVVANNYYALSLSKETIIGGGLNVYNYVTAKVFDKKIILSENGAGEKRDFAYMTLRHCPIKAHVGGDCKSCKYQKGYTFVMEGGKELFLKRKKLSDCTFYLTSIKN